MEIKVNHQKTFTSLGYVYQRGFKINRKTYLRFMWFMDGEIMELDYLDSLYLKLPFEVCECEKRRTLYFMNLTQTKLFVDWVLKSDDLEINEKRARLKANGYMEVLD